MRRRLSLSVERLDARLVPSSCRHVALVTDALAQSGKGSLSFEVAHARPGTTIRFAPGIRAALVLHPLDFNVRGLRINGGPKGVLLLTDSPVVFNRPASLNHVVVIPFSDGTASLQ